MTNLKSQLVMMIGSKIIIDNMAYINGEDGDKVLEWSPTLQLGVLQHSLHIFNLMRSPITMHP